MPSAHDITLSTVLRSVRREFGTKPFWFLAGAFLNGALLFATEVGATYFLVVFLGDLSAAATAGGFHSGWAKLALIVGLARTVAGFLQEVLIENCGEFLRARMRERAFAGALGL